MSLTIEQQLLIQNDKFPEVADDAASSSSTLSQERIGRSPGTVRQESVQRMSVPDLRSTRAESGADTFFSRIAQWFHHPATPNRVEIPPQLEVSLPSGGKVVYDSASFLNSIKTVPRSERAAFIQSLPGLLATRIANGHTTMRSVINGSPVDATRDNIADMMLFLDAKTRAEGNGFDHGAFSIEDPEGRILDFLNSCPDKYLRSSSHMVSNQSAPLKNGQMNVHRGLDVPPGTHGLPNKMATILFAAIPGQDDVSQRIFLKMETCGCRLSSLSARERTAGQDAFGERPINWQADLGNSLRHLASFIKTRFISTPNARKERVPTQLISDYQAICKQNAKSGYISNQALERLAAGNPAGTSNGVHTLIANMRTAYAEASTQEKIGLAATYRLLIESMQRNLDDVNALSSRIGNEKMFSLDEMIQDVDPTRQAPVQKYGKSAVALNELAEPMVAELITNLQSFTAGKSPTFLQTSSNLLTLFYHGGGGIQAMADALEMSLDTALSRLTQVEKQNLYTALTSDLGKLNYAAASNLLMQMRFNAPEDTPIGGKIGGIAYHDFLLTGLISSLEKDLGIPHEQPLTSDSSNATIQKHFFDEAKKQLADLSQHISPEGITRQFTIDVIDRYSNFTINGIPCNDSKTFIEQVPSTAMRIALSALVNQASAAYGQALMSQVRLAPVLDGRPSLAFRYAHTEGTAEGVLEMEYTIPYKHLLLPTGDMVELRGSLTQKAHFTFNTDAQTPKAALVGADPGTIALHWE